MEASKDVDVVMVTCKCSLRMPLAFIGQHLKTFHPYREIECELCGSRFRSGFELQNHKTYAHICQKFSTCRCQECLLLFENPTYLKGQPLAQSSKEMAADGEESLGSENLVKAQEVLEEPKNKSPSASIIRPQSPLGNLSSPEVGQTCPQFESLENPKKKETFSEKPIRNLRFSNLVKVKVDRHLEGSTEGSILFKWSPSPQKRETAELRLKGKENVSQKEIEGEKSPEKVSKKPKNCQSPQPKNLDEFEGTLCLEKAEESPKENRKFPKLRNLRSGNLDKGKPKNLKKGNKEEVIPCKKPIGNLEVNEGKKCPQLSNNLEKVKNKRPILTQAPKKCRPFKKLNLKRKLFHTQKIEDLEERKKRSKSQKLLVLNLKSANLDIAKACSSKSSALAEVQFKCSICSRRYSNKGNLTQHQKNVHQNLRRFKCVKCQKGYSTKQKLARHFLVHSKNLDFGCPNCPKRFGTRDVMVKHNNCKHLGKSYPCFKCDKVYSWPERLSKHLRKEHSTR